MNKVLFLTFSLLTQIVHAGVPAQEIQKAMGQYLAKYQSAPAWKELTKSKPGAFPKDLKVSQVIVDKLPLELKGETFTLGIGYRQFFMKAPMARVKKIFNSPELWKNLFGLDGETTADSTGETFKARIFKKVPVLSNQDYTLEYRNLDDQGITFQRATQVNDKNELALRDNLSTLEEVEGGVLFREVSLVYVLRWYLRALGPQVRSVTESEMGKINLAIKCTAESDKPLTSELASDCYKRAEKGKL